MVDRRIARKQSPAVTIRFRTKKELAILRQAAKVEGMSLNTFVAAHAAVAAEQILKSYRAALAIEQSQTPSTVES